MKIERALISVSDRTGLPEFARALVEMGVELISTGGTACALKESGIPVREVSEITGFPELLDGRIKTLHPRIHAGLLYRRDQPDHVRAMTQHELAGIDLVCVNLYPFEAKVARPDSILCEAIEQIDIGGPALLRSAAKNHAFVTVVSDPADYPRVLEEMRRLGGGTSDDLRMELAQKAFARTAAYDAAIAGFLAARQPGRSVPGPLVLAALGGTRLRYGENPHQEAFFYRMSDPQTACIAFAELLHGKEMSFNNYVDGDAALETVREFCGVPAAAVIKHTNPCGCATGRTVTEALAAAWDGDPVSAFGGVIAVSVPFTAEAAGFFTGRFVEVLIAPDYEPEALAQLKARSAGLRILKLHRPLTPPVPGRVLRQVHGGWLVQDRDTSVAEHWMIPTEALFPEEKRQLAEFGVRVCKHLKSNAVAIVWEYEAGQFALLGMGAGQPNRVDAVRKLAVARARENIGRLATRGPRYGQLPKEIECSILGESILVSDAFFPFPDSIEAAAEAGLRYVVQPGGSKKDEEVIAACDRYGIAMAITGVRHFLH